YGVRIGELSGAQVRRRRNDVPMQLLDGPAMLHEPRGQPVEQFRVRRLAAHFSEVVRRGNQSATKMLLPDTVDEHTGSQGIIGADQPAREREPATFPRRWDRSVATALSTPGATFVAGASNEP